MNIPPHILTFGVKYAVSFSIPFLKNNSQSFKDSEASSN
jgi:hypothetical protein